MVLAFTATVQTTFADFKGPYLAAKEEICAARPTAVNLSWGANLMYAAAQKLAAAGKQPVPELCCTLSQTGATDLRRGYRHQ
jgi:methylthioribose-1-phosphate isomerase